MFKSIRDVIGPERRVDGEPRNSRGAGGRRRPLFAACVVLALLSISAGAYFAWPRSSSGPAMYATNDGGPGSSQGAASGQTAQAANPTPTRVTGNAQAATKPVILAPRNPAHVAAWKQGGGGRALASINQQIGTVLMAHGAGQYANMRQACVRLASSVQAANDSAPIPDATMERLYKRALTLIAAGTTSCQAAVTSHREGVEDTALSVKTPLLNQAVADFGTGIRDLYSATTAIRTIKKA